MLAFILMNVVLAGYFLDSIPSPNPTSRVLPVIALFEDGTYAIDRYADTTMDKSFIDGHYYSDKAPLSTWLVLPVYGLLKQAGLPAADIFYFKWLPVAFIGGVLCGTVPFVVLVWLIARRLEREDPSANVVLLSMLPLYGSFVAAYSGVFVGHLLAGILLTGSYALLKSERRPALCGFLVGLAVVAEYPAALALPVWISSSCGDDGPGAASIRSRRIAVRGGTAALQLRDHRIAADQSLRLRSRTMRSRR